MSTLYARVVDSIVVETLTLPGGVALADAMHPDFVPFFLACPDNVEAGWQYDGAAFAPPSPPAPPTAADLVAYAADKRWRVETGGISVAGVPVATDDRSKTMIMGARIKADADSSYAVGWKGADGSFASLSAPQIIAISDAVLAHVDACFGAEATVASAIADGGITTIQQVDDWPWPG